jgi:iron complex outermembrane recepter protein
MDFRNGLFAVFCCGSGLALTVAARAQDVTTLVVTGSRVATSSADSPTPLTVVSIEQLQATTPSNIPDSLNKLPIFQGSNTPDNVNNAGSNFSGNVLNMRNFGVQRTLVLLDGKRVTPTNSDGTVDVDTLPQMLVSRVDVVTGGASAVYGSDAVTGVVNFVLNKKFQGLKLSSNAGISNYGDGASYQFGAAAGTSLFGGRGHIEGSVKYLNSDAIRTNAREIGRNNYTLTGAGTAANPYVTTPNATRTNLSFGGYITCAGTAANPCTANGKQFIENGVIGPFAFGTPTGSPTIAIGGDGAYSNISDMRARLRTTESFLRTSFDLNDTVTAYVQGSLSESYNFAFYQNTYMQTGALPNTFFKNNPFLPAAAQAQLAGGTANTFSVAKYFLNPPGQPRNGITSEGQSSNSGITTGLEGTLLDKYDWEVFYTHGASRLKESDPGNQDNQRMFAAEDAVLNAAGQPVCYVSTTAFANLYPNCVPMNPFGPTSITASQYNYFVQNSTFTMSQTMDNAGASISGKVFELPAGPMKAAVSTEYRHMTYKVDSLTPPGTVDCTGLRLCNPATPRWQENVQANQPLTTQSVWEVALELGVPLIKDVPLIQSLTLDLAGRHTDYSVSGPVHTWKVGLDYHVNDTIRFRGTTSVDIRAPTLVDLFSPIQLGAAGFVDPHTGNFVGITQVQRQGNPNLVPEEGRTYTAGIVLTPTFAPGLVMSLDYYTITLTKGIGVVGGNTLGIAQQCELSNGTSPYCDLFIRPLPFSDHTPANYPTRILSQGLNTASNRAAGWDFEADYGFDLSAVRESLPGTLNMRVLANYQKTNTTQNFVGAAVTNFLGPKGRVTANLDYKFGTWTFALQDRWLSTYARSSQPGILFYQQPRGVSLNYIDINVGKNFEIADRPFSFYLAVQNIANKPMPIQPDVVATPGLWAGGIQLPSRYGIDKIGRYFTLGVRVAL